MEFLSETGYARSAFDGRVTAFLRRVLEPLGANIEPGYGDLFFGNIPGCIGEVSAFLLLLGAAYLFTRKIITWHIPVSYLATFGVLVWIFGGSRFGSGAFSGNVVFHFFTGGLILGAFYMATDMVTSPITKTGQIIFAVGIGIFTVVIRLWGGYPEGVSYSILLMNLAVPLINRYTKPRVFGEVKNG